MSFLVATSRSGIRSASQYPSYSFIAPSAVATSQVTLGRRKLSSSARMDEKFAPAKRVAGQKQDVWSIVNEAAAASPKQPIGKSPNFQRSTSLTASSEHGTRVFVSMVCPGRLSPRPLTHEQRLQPSPVHHRRCKRSTRSSRMQPILSYQGTTKVEEGNRRCI